MNGAHLVSILSLLALAWMLLRAHVETAHRKHQADLDARLKLRREYRAELLARRGPRIRGCVCDCHHLSAIR